MEWRNSLYNEEMSFLKSFSKKNPPEIHHLLFHIGLGWRIAYGSLRLMLGIMVLRLIGMPLSDLFYKLMSHELVEDPTDVLIKMINPLLQHLSFTVNYFLAAYLIFWGLMDIFLSINMLNRKKWAFPVSMYLIGLFVLYEIYRFSYTHSVVLAGIIIIDLLLVWLIWKETTRINLHPSHQER